MLHVHMGTSQTPCTGLGQHTALLTACMCCVSHYLRLQAVLESIRDSLNEQLVIPEWLVDIFLGYGDAGAAHYTQMNGLIRTVDFKVRKSDR